MAIFTMIATYLATTALFAGTFFATATGISVVALGLGLATTIGVSYVMKALAGTPSTPATQDHFGTQGTIAAGGDIPRSFGLGYHATAGSLAYANYWGSHAPGGVTTPNAYLTQVIALSDLPGEQLLELWVNGERATIGALDSSPQFGNQVVEYIKDGQVYLWVKYYNGTQTAADPLCTGFATSAERPYAATRIGKGICYAVVTALVEDTLFKGFPTFKFALSGIPLYDPSKDSSNGGSGAHRYADPSTWGGDGDQLPAVQIYNLLRGIRYAGAWLYGLQNLASSARLPAANWNAQIAKCRATVVGLSGPEPSYRAGGQISVEAQPANAIEALLTACQGRLSEIGGFYKLHLGAPDAAVFSWTDADLLSSEQQTFRPFFSLADSVNGIQGTYPDPAQGWQTQTAPPLYRADLELRDGSRRLMAAPAFDMVPYPEQVQRLQKSGIEESQRARSHVLPMPPAYWTIEPGDVGTWSSVRNGYTDKLFRVDHVVDRANLDCVFSVTEVDPADYSWNHATDYTGVSTGPTVIPRPPPQGVVDWYAEGTVLYDADGLGRHAAIRIAWDGTLPGVVGVQYEVRLSADLSSVTRGRTDQLAAGALIVSQGIIELTAYQVRGQYLPSSPRDMLWSDWLDVTTPGLPAVDIPAWIGVQVTSVFDLFTDRQIEFEQRISTVTGTSNQRNWLDLKDVRTQLNSRSEAAFAEISRVETVATSSDAAMASDIETLTAEVTTNTGNIATNTANITINATAIADLDSATASDITSLTASVNTNTANISTNATAIANTNTAFSNYKITNDAAVGANTSGVATNATAIATLNGYAAAQYSVTLDVNGYAVGFNLFNGGPGTSSTVFVTDKFLIAAPGVAGPVPIFAVGNVAGSPKVAIRGDMYVDGSIAGSKIIAGTITANELAADSVTSAKILAGTIQASDIQAGAITSDSGVIGALGVKSLSIQDNAVTVPAVQNFAGVVLNASTGLASFSLSIDTTGLAGKPITVFASASILLNTWNFGSTVSFAFLLQINGISALGTPGGVWQAPAITLASSVTITGSGGVMSIPVAVSGSSNAPGAFNASGSLFAQAAKR